MFFSPTPSQPAGLYVHIPFCRKKCAYCDFFSITDLRLIASFAAALRREIDMMVSKSPLFFDTLYIGGGTPSILSESQLIDMIESIKKYINICSFNEITIEINPESATKTWLKAARQTGINRVSIGVQSFDDKALAFLGRIHSARQAKEAIAAARSAGFENIGLDIIYGLPGQTRAGLEADLKQAISYAPEHISCYLLTIESGTPLAESLKKKEFEPLSESQTADMFLVVSEILTANGYLHYEISNFSRGPETRSRHNLKYWQRFPYLGLGPSAHSYSRSERHWNVKNVPLYVKRLSSGLSPRLPGEVLSVRQQMMEALYLGLRLRKGIDAEAFNREFEVDFQTRFAPVLSKYEATGMLSLAGGRCHLSTRGMLFHETIVSDLTDLL